MSVDKTIEELSGTLSQLGILVEHINTQIIGITSRINMTLDNFDKSVEGIASDAGLMTNQVGDTISQVPNAWVFYLLFITLIIVLILLSVLIIINLATRLHAIYRIIRGNTSRSASPVPSAVYSESKQPLNVGNYPLSSRGHISVPMESEPRIFGRRDPASTFNGSQDFGSGVGTNAQGTYYPPSRPSELKRSRLYRFAPKRRTLRVKSRLQDQLSTSFVHYSPVCVDERRDLKKEDDGMPPQIESAQIERIVSMLEANNNSNEAYLRRPLNPKDSTQFDQRPVNGSSVNEASQRVAPPRYQQKPFVPYNHQANGNNSILTRRGAEPV